jgi:hypothetical protein
VNIKYKISRAKYSKIGFALSVAIFSVIFFLTGGLSYLEATGASSTSALPLSKGGTGKNSFPSGEAIIGNGANPLTTRGIDTSPSPGSNNLITSGAANDINQIAINGAGIYNYYKRFSVSNSTTADNIYILGKLPTLGSSDPNYTVFIGQFIVVRNVGQNALPRTAYMNIVASNGYSEGSLASLNKFSILKQGFSAIAELGYFNYQGQRYLGIRLKDAWGAGYASIHGFYRGNLPTTCSDTVTICLSTTIAYAYVDSYIPFTPSII